MQKTIIQFDLKVKGALKITSSNSCHKYKKDATSTHFNAKLLIDICFFFLKKNIFQFALKNDQSAL